MLRFEAFGTNVRPPSPAVQFDWAKNESAPGFNDGTRLNAAWANRVRALLDAVRAAAGLTDSETDDGLLNAAIGVLIAAAVSGHTHNVAALLDGSGYVRMTDAERTKLAALDDNFRGVYANLTALEAAFPAASEAAGSWAVLTHGAGVTATIAAVDSDNTPQAWVDTGVAGAANAAALSVTPAGGISSNNAQAALEELDAEKQPLSANLTSWAALAPSTKEDAQTAASQAEAEAGTEAAVRKFSPLRIAQAIAALTAVPGVLYGFGLANNATDATNDIDVVAGEARDSTNAAWLRNTATVIKQLDVAFAEYSSPGTASGGRDSADNLTGAKWFHVHVIGGVGKNVQPFFSTSLTPTLPSGFTWRRRVGSIYWTGSAIAEFFQNGDRFLWKNAPLDVDTTEDTTADLRTLSVPIGVRVIAHLNLATTGAVELYVSSPDSNDAAPSLTAAPLYTFRSQSSSQNGIRASIETNASAQVRTRAASAGTPLRIATLGWDDRRGRD